MSASLELLDRTDDSGRALFRLTADYEYELGPGSVITVPSGYVTNFGTIPRWLSWWISPAQLGEAAIVHDWICNEDFSDNGGPPLWSGYSRWMGDAILYEAMARRGFSWIKRASTFAVVRSYALWKSARWPDKPTELKVNEK